MLFEIILFGILSYLLYKYFDVYDYWEKKGVPCLKGKFPFGSKSTLEFLKRYQAHVLKEYYDELNPHPYGGFYLYTRPVLLLRDPDVIKQVMAGDFSHFRSRFGHIYSKKEPLTQHLFNLEGDLWKSVRVKLTPTFTSGKLKTMYTLFEVCSNEFLKQLINEQDKDINIKESVARFTTDIISTCAFGLEVDSINNPDDPIRKFGSQLMVPGFSFTRKMKLIFFSLFPYLETALPVRRFPYKFEKFLMTVIGNTIEFREKNNVKRNDFLDLLIEMKNKREEKQENSDVKPIVMDLPMITAQCFVFFLAGFETSSSVQSNTLHELALNQEIQDKVRSEIKQVLEKHGGKPTYQALQEMPYLEKVIYETMRKYPTLPILTRECTKNWRTDSGLEIEKGTRLYIPVYALHHDPKYFPNPDVFDPERFSDENKKSFPQFAYLPFGEGPRMCIGMRFGLIQTKLGLVTVLSNFKISPSDKTTNPLKFAATSVIAAVEGPMYIKLEKI